jgi:hypothetical protein
LVWSQGKIQSQALNIRDGVWREWIKYLSLHKHVLDKRCTRLLWVRNRYDELRSQILRGIFSSSLIVDLSNKLLMVPIIDVRQSQVGYFYVGFLLHWEYGMCSIFRRPKRKKCGTVVKNGGTNRVSRGQTRWSTMQPITM